jgi:hypothetical protein
VVRVERPHHGQVGSFNPPSPLIRSPHANLFQHAEYLDWLLNHVDVSVVDEIARDVGQGDSSWT